MLSGVGQHGQQMRPPERTPPARIVPQGAEAAHWGTLAQRRFQGLYLLQGLVRKGIQVEDLDARLAFAVKPGIDLGPEQVLLQHSSIKCWQNKKRPPRVGRYPFIAGLGHVGDRVQPHEVANAQGRAGGPSHQRSGQRINLGHA